MPLRNEVLEDIDRFVRAGFESKHRIVKILAEEIYEPGELDVGELADAVDDAVARHEHSKAGWPPLTDNDRLTAAFGALNRRGIIALENAGYTQSDGYELFRKALADRDVSDIHGYCFFHGQDTEGAVDGRGLYLAFGPTDPNDEDTQGAKIGEIVVDELQHAGLTTEWNGSIKQRILVPTFDWKRRSGPDE